MTSTSSRTMIAYWWRNESGKIVVQNMVGDCFG